LPLSPGDATEEVKRLTAALETYAQASNRATRKIVLLTWVLVIATLVLVAVTVVTAVHA